MRRPADFDEPLWGRDTWPMLVAALEGDERTVRDLLGRDPSLARAEYAYLTPLHYAVRGGRSSMVRLLLDAGADARAPGWSGTFGAEVRDDSPLARARDREQHEIVAMLEAAPVLPPRSDRVPPRSAERDLEDEMMLACHHGDVARATALMDAHAGLAQAGLYEAVHQDHPALVRLLLERGADATVPWRWACWYTPLMHALRYPEPRWEIARLLLDHGVSPDETNGMGMAALHVLAGQATTDAVRWLVEQGADVHARDAQYDSTPLAWAARAGREDVVRLLLSLGARPVHPDDASWATPEAWARRRGHEAIAELLASAGGD